VYSFASDSPLDLHALRSRLEAMDSAALMRFGQAAAYIHSPLTNMEGALEAFMVRSERRGRSGGAS